MRTVGLLLIPLAVLAWWGVEADPTPGRPPAPPTMAEARWRRTSTGWETLGEMAPPPPFRPALDPSLLAAFEVLVSIAALLALPSPTTAPAAVKAAAKADSGASASRSARRKQRASRTA